MDGMTIGARRWRLWPCLVSLVAALAMLVLLATPDFAYATQEVWVRSWGDLYNAIARAETTDEQIYIRVAQQFSRWEGDPDLVIHSGDVLLNLDGFNINPRVNGQPAGNGRVITLEGGRLTLWGEEGWSSGGLTGGSAEQGGAVLVQGGELVIESGLIKDNSADYGAAVAVMDGSCTIVGGSITGNSAGQGSVYVGPGGTLTVTGGTIWNNNAKLGGGIYGAGGEIELSGGVIRGNSASVDGGGVYVGGGDFSLMGEAVLEENRASGSGGNLALGEDPNGVAFMEGGVIRYGSAANGGGVAALAGKFLFFDGEIVSNSAACGAGVATLGGSAYIEGGLVHDNSASLKGGGVYVGQGALCVWGGSVESNCAEAVDDEWGETATAEGGGIYVGADGRLEVKGFPVIASNMRGDKPQDIFLEGEAIINVTDRFTPTSAVGVDLLDLPALGETRAIATTGQYGADAFSCQAPDCELVYESAGGGQGTALLRRVREHEGTRVSSWADLSQRLRALGRGEEASFWLESDLTYGTGLPEAYATRPLEVRRDAKVTIDLNGYAINRGMASVSQPTSEDSERCLYVSLGSLVIRDGRGGGRITGGCCQRGAGIFLAEGSLVLEGGNVTDNKANYGAGIYVGMGTFEMKGGRIYDNLGLAQGLPCGGGVYVGDNSNLPQLESEGEDSGLGEIAQASMTMTGGTIDTNKSAGWGAGVCISNGLFSMVDGSIGSNTKMDSAKQGGGGIYACGESTVSLSGGSVNNNQLTNKEGAGVSIHEGSSAVLSDVVILRNYSNWDGGGVCVEESDLVIDGASINSNTTRGSGGGVVVKRGGTCRIDSGSINDNRANACGAGVQVHLGASCTMSDGELKGNLADSGNALEGDMASADDSAGDEGASDEGVGGESLGSEFTMGGAFNVQGELVLSGGTIAGNAAIIGSGICFDCEYWQSEKGRLVISGSPLFTDNYYPWSNKELEDISIYMGNDADESARVAVEGSFTPEKPLYIEKVYRNNWDYVALVDPGSYDMSVFACGQGRDRAGSTDYVLVKRDGVLYAYRHSHTWELHTSSKWPDRATVTCIDASCPFFEMEAVLRLGIEGITGSKSEIPYDGKPHAAFLTETDVPTDLSYSVEYIYYAGESTDGYLLSRPPVDPGVYTVTAEIKTGKSTATITKTFRITQSNFFDEGDGEYGGGPIEAHGSGGVSGNGGAVGSSRASRASQVSKGSATQLPQTSDEPMSYLPALALVGGLALLLGMRLRRADTY